MRLRNLKILGVFIAFGLSFLFHFIYDWFPNIITSIFFPVNESIFEHMKIIFGTILLSGVVQKIISVKKNLGYDNILISSVIVAFLSIFIFLAMFLPFYYTFGENFMATIIIMFITYVISQVLSIYIMKFDFPLENYFLIIFIVIIYILFGIFTYHPLYNDFFIDPTNQTFGIEKEVP